MVSANVIDEEHQRPSIAIGAGPHWIEQLFAVVTALIFWTDALKLAFPGFADEPSIVFRLTVLAIYTIVGSLIIRRSTETLRCIASSPLLGCLLFLPLLSALWSIEPGITFHRSIALLGSSAFGIYLATQVSETRVIALLGLTATLSAVMSLVLIVAVPSIGLMQDGEYEGVWRGAYEHKNAFGQMTALGAIACLIAWRFGRQPRPALFLPGLLVNLILLAGSRSLTAQLLVVACAGILFVAGPVVKIAVDHSVALLSGLIFLVFISVISAASGLEFKDLLTLLGKSATLSDRLPLWQTILPFALEKFWLGYGYEVFWLDGHYPVDIIVKKMYFNPSYSHNGLLETWLGLGALGVGTFLVVFAQFVYRSGVLLYRNPTSPIFLFSAVFIVLTIFANASEVTILQRNNIVWVLFVMFSASLSLKIRAAEAGSLRATEQTYQAPRVTPSHLDVI
jgi:exopolysaccharide production protein ExoQ